jgi:hypothetical protein
VPARTAACCGPPGGHKGRPYQGERLATPSIWLTRSTSDLTLTFVAILPGPLDLAREPGIHAPVSPRHLNL